MNGRVARNLLTTLLTQLFTWSMSFVVLLYLPKYLGSSGMGQLSYATSLATVFGALVPLGTSLVLQKEIARDRSRAADLLSASIWMRLPLAILVTLITVGMTFLLHETALTISLVLVACIGMGMGMITDALVSTLLGLERVDRQNISQLTERTTFFVVMIGLILVLRNHAVTPLALIAIVGVSIVSNLAAITVNLTAFRPLRDFIRPPRWTEIKLLGLAGMPFLGWMLFRTLYGTTDPIILRYVANFANAGYYSVAFRLIGTTMFLPNAVTMAIFPTLSRLHLSDPSEFRALGRRLFGVVMLCAVPLAFVLAVMPDRVMALMPYKHQFAKSIPVLQIGGIGILLWFGASILGSLVLASDGQHKMFGASVMATVVGVPLCVIFSWVGYHWYGNGPRVRS